MATHNNKTQLRQEAIDLLTRYDAIRMEAIRLEAELNKACADYGRVTNPWGFGPQHLRIELHHEKERAA